MIVCIVVIVAACMIVSLQLGIYVIMEVKQEDQPANIVFNEANDQDTRSLLLDTLVFIQRREHMNHMCKIYGNLHRNVFDNTKDLDHILVDVKRKLLYCYVPKVACTNWKRVFMILMGTAKAENVSTIPAEIVHRKSTFPRLSDYTTDEAKFFIENFTKYVFVRHPFERLLSAFRNKLETRSQRSKYFQTRIGRTIVRNYRKQATNRSLEFGDDVTFEEFAAYLVDRYVPSFNEHWKPISELCYPCLIRYDFIGKYETLQSDAEFLLRAINESRITFPRVRRSNTTARVSAYYNNLSSPIIARLYNIFVLDFKLFSYGTENILGYEIG